MAGKTKPQLEQAAEDGAIIVKKYANRRLYNTATSSYVTLDDLSEMVKEGLDFIVYDAKSGDDITRSVLTQIIFEQESRGQNLLPIQFLRRLIRFYGDSMQGFVPSYLEASMEAFSRQQEQMRDTFSDTFGAARAMETFEEHARQNMAIFEKTMRLFAPTLPVDGAAGDGGAPADASAEAVAELRREMAAMQRRLDDITKPS